MSLVYSKVDTAVRTSFLVLLVFSYEFIVSEPGMLKEQASVSFLSIL